ncbi:ATP-dependent permease [Knufia obscura]|uniref:ATP-dependent permease n=1 Tax=Knufia obscura TaxID=1635080 RepID=A0ABR0RRV8_9EURO|nr:ATP-dependent permease [Knufia obscura]
MLQDVEEEGPAQRRLSQHERQTRSGGILAFKIIFSFTRTSHLLFLIPAFLLAALSGFMLPIMSILIGCFLNSLSQFAAGTINDDELTKGSMSTVYAFVGVGLGMWVVKGGFCCAWIMYGESQAQAVREDLFSALLVRDLAWFEAQQAGVGTLLSRIQTHIREFQLGVSQPLGLATIAISQSIASLGVALYHNWKLTLVLLATFPVITFALSFLSRGSQKAIRQQQSELTSATKQASNAISNLTVLKCHNTQASEARTYAHILRAVCQQSRKQVRIVATQLGFMRFAATGLLVLALFFGDHLIHNVNASVGAVLTTFWCCTTASKSFNEILTHILVLEKGRAAAVALQDLLEKVGQGKRLSDRFHGYTPPNLEGDIVFRNVDFAYPARKDHKILHNVTFFFPAHETTYVVGKSGSGKSTLSTLLLKFYAPSSGEVTIDGKDVRKLDTSWLRNNVTLVQQDSVLFHGTISDNIIICNDSSNITAVQMSDCLTFSELEETMRSLPDGIHTKVGKGGASLSGGQRQRIALARARLRDTPVLILDESTSALDETGKIHVMRNIREWRKDKTTIIITHDLSQIKSGDFVYVLKGGTVIAEGYRSAVKAKLEDTQDLDMIGTPLTPFTPFTTLQEDAQPTLARERMMHGLRPTPMRTRSDVSMSSLSSTATEHMPGSDTNLLATSDPSTNNMARARRSIRSFLSSRTLLSSTQRVEARADLTEGELDLEYEMLQISKSRKLHNRLTMAQAARPLTTHATLSMRPAYQPQDMATPLPARPITIWDDVMAQAATGPHPDEDVIKNNQQTTLSMRQILFTVWPNLRLTDRPWLIVAITAASAYAAIPSVSAWIMVHLFSTFYQNEGWVQEARKWSLILMAVGCADGGIAFTIHYLFQNLAQAWITALRQNAFMQILLQPKSWFDGEQYSITEMCNILDTAAGEVRDLLSKIVSFGLMAIIMVLVSVIWSLTTCWKLTLVALACTPAVYGVSKLLNIVSARWETRSGDAAETVSDIFAESFSEVRTVRSLTLESHFHKKYIKAASQAFVTGQNRGIFIGLCFGLADSSVPFVTACMFGYGAILAKSGEYTTQSVLTVLPLLLFAMMGASSILGFIPQISTSVDAGNRILRLANLPSTSHESKDGMKLLSNEFIGVVEFKQVKFSYPSRPDATVLKGLNLTIEAGQHTALVGRSGCGKSTIISLLLGLYPISHGVLEVSSHDIRHLDLSSLRSFIAYVPQQPVLFPTSIRQNISYGLTTDDEDEDVVTSAARSAGIHDFITSLPSGYDTIIGDGGTGVSGGQAQRIVLARAFARRPKILLMDEPTSALDVESSETIRDSIMKLSNAGAESPTIVIVTHTREMMEIADKVVVLEDGVVVEEGKFDSLMQKRDKLWQLLNVEGE